MITGMLQRLGLFFGAQRDHHDESEFFLDLNQWLLQQAGGAWDHPEPIDHVLERDDLRALYADYLRYMVQTRGRVKFLTWTDALRMRSLHAMPRAWGWKDPRNTFTLPLWLDVFPDARVVHVVRHGVDVARSLRKREREQVEQSRSRYDRRRLLYWMRPKKNGFLDSPRCLSLCEGIRLWDVYVERAMNHVGHLDIPSHTVRYETFLAEPVSILERLAEFCSIDAVQSDLEACGKLVDPSRAFAYRNVSPINIPDKVIPLIDKHGYSL
jgi:hypothetical protein